MLGPPFKSCVLDYWRYTLNNRGKRESKARQRSLFVATSNLKFFIIFCNTKFLVCSFFQYFFSFTSPWQCWNYCNGVVHGHTLQKAHCKTLEELHEKVLHAYETYEGDCFVISHQLSSIVDKPLKDMMNMDIDYLRCWLIRTYDEAVLAQQDF
jgi:hypothetical protein